MFTLLSSLMLLVGPTPHAKAEVKIEIKQIHMCCEGCAEEVETVLKKVEGVSGVQVVQKKRTATFTAPDAVTAQKAIDALANDGFHGEVNDKSIAFKNDSGVKDEKVTSMTVTGFHNTCPGCVNSFRTALKRVEGVASDDCKSKVSTCTVKGNFNAIKLVEELNREGFHVKVKN